MQPNQIAENKRGIIGRIMDFLDVTTGRSTEKEFLPAALEIMETPPSPMGIVVSRFIIGFFVIGLVWAFVGKVDIVAVSKGKIIPTGRTKIIQPLDSGVVKNILVHDGQRVKAGDVLVEIDSTISEAERNRLQKEYIKAALDVARLQASLDINNNDPIANFTAPEGATDDQISVQQSLMLHQVGEIQARLSGISNQIKQNEGNRQSVAATINKLKESIPYLQQRADAMGQLAKKGYGSKMDYLTIAQDLVEHKEELKVQKGRLVEAGASISALEDQKTQEENNYKQMQLTELADAQQKANSLNEQLIQATRKYSMQTLKSPVDGTVQQLAIHTEGGVVTPAQVLMSIVPLDSKIEIEAMISNRDIGFVRAGQEARIKVDTFNFTKYGLVNGVVKSVSKDAILRENPSAASKGAKQNMYDGASSEPAGQDLVYSAHVELDQTQMNINGKMINLEPGMAVTVEIKTGSRRVIEYLLSPLQRHTEEAFREM